jgi:HEAT repeat protein
MGLVCALSGSASAQPAAPAAAKTAAKGRKTSKKAKAPPVVKVDLGPAIAALNGSLNEAAAKAAEQIGMSTEPAAHEALLDALAFGMPPSVAIASINALGMHPAPPDVTALVRYASHHNPGVRSAALGVLAMYPAEAARKALVGGLHDQNPAVRGAAAMAAAKGHAREAIEPLFELLARGEDSASKALAAMADADLARKIGDQLGKVPDPILATTLGRILTRPDFGPDPARVALVRTLGKIQDASAVSALTDYLDASPKKPSRASRQEAQKMVEARLGGGK